MDVHDRDTNAAKNILARGLVELESEFSAAGEAKADEAAVNKAVSASGAAGVGHDPLDAGIPSQFARGGCQIKTLVSDSFIEVTFKKNI